MIIISLFVAEVAKQLKLRRMTQRQLAEAVHYEYQAVRRFMCGLTENEGMKKAIAAYLGIEI